MKRVSRTTQLNFIFSIVAVLIATLAGQSARAQSPGKIKNIVLVHGAFADGSGFMYASQGPIAARCFADKITTAAFRTKPSFAIVSTEDKAINPDIERNMYKRAGMKVTEIKASHVAFISQPVKVAAVITEAATTAGH